MEEDGGAGHRVGGSQPEIVRVLEDHIGRCDDGEREADLLERVFDDLRVVVDV